MAFLRAVNCRVFWNDDDLSAYLNEASAEQEVDEIETTTFTNNDKTYLVGLRGGTISLSGFYDPTTLTGSDQALQTTLGSTTAVVATIFTAGDTWTAGNGATPPGTTNDVAWLVSGRQTSYNISQAVDGAVEVEVEATADGGVRRGHTLHTSTTAETSSTASNNHGHDGGAATSNGGVAHLHVTAAAGTATIAIKAGTDGTTYGTTLTTFTGVTTSPTSERKTWTGSTPRYVRSESTLGSSPSYNYAVAYARNP